jgi:hypothetical protein
LASRRGDPDGTQRGLSPLRAYEADGFWQFKRVVQSGLAVTHEPAYADKRSKDCEAKSASE